MNIDWMEVAKILNQHSDQEFRDSATRPEEIARMKRQTGTILNSISVAIINGVLSAAEKAK